MIMYTTCRPGQKASNESIDLLMGLIGEFIFTSYKLGPFDIIYCFIAV